MSWCNTKLKKMATIIYKSNLSNGTFILCRDDVVEDTSKYRGFNPVKRDGYMRESHEMLLFFHYPSDMKSIRDGHTTPDEMFKFFNIDNKKDGYQFIRNIDPWLCLTESYDLVLYFGEDKPIRKEKTVKTMTQHRKFWAHHNKWNWEGKPATYSYWEVKDKSKLIIADTGHDLTRCFPELKYKPKPLEIVDLSLNEPFKCSDNYDYTDSEKEEIIKKELEEKAKREKYEAEIEERKQTPGWCSHCGLYKAELVANPYDYEMNGIITMEYICPNCYRDICGDI